MINVGIFGFSGRVGKLILEEVSKISDMKVSSVYAKSEGSFDTPMSVNIGEFLANCDVVIDFSAPTATSELLMEGLKSPKPMIIGTTGLTPKEMSLLNNASKKMPILYSTNMSKGVAVLNEVVSLVSRYLKDCDIEISEMHHRHKKDSPSGTALSLAESCAIARGLELSDVRVSARDGMIGERTKNEIAVMSLRGGDVVGKHTVGFYCDGEYLELTHNATDRVTFAKGAIDSARWIISQKNGLYGIKDILSL